ncbi:hypothetical protein DFJ73DRAFT_914459 [Zopfochytrium polystomum]|nr:hypothetical protein DFJ73DRAFT_914459 [Zopfochytrium polystomum]
MSTPTVVFITGANSGIGFGTAALLAAAPDARYHVLLGVRSVEKGQKAVQDIRARGSTAPLTLVRIDVSDPASVRAAADQVAAEIGRVDVLVNNAGIVVTSGDLVTSLPLDISVRGADYGATEGPVEDNDAASHQLHHNATDDDDNTVVVAAAASAAAESELVATQSVCGRKLHRTVEIVQQQQ